MLSFILLLVRHGMAVLGAYFMAHGINTSSTESMVIGLVALAVPVVWSFVAKILKFDTTWALDPTLNDKLRTAFGSLISQGITFLSAYYAVDAHDPSALAVALVNAIASHYGVQQQIAHQTPISVAAAVKVLLACGCVLGLASCAQWDKFVASPQGKATATLVDLGADVAVATGLLPVGSNVLIQEGVAIVTDPNKPGVQKTVDLEKLGLDKAVDAKLVTPGDSLIIQQDTAIIQKAITPLLPGAKQPVSVAAKNPVVSVLGRQNRLKPVLHNVPACLQLAGGVPLYGERVAFVLSTGAVRN